MPDGSHVGSFEVDIAPYSLAVTSKGTIILRDLGGKSVHIVDSKGHLLHVILPPAEMQYWQPRGMICYCDIICICDFQMILSGAFLRQVNISDQFLLRSLEVLIV